MGDSYDDLGPGLHVLRDADPLRRAGTMAARLHAHLCATLEQADAAVAAYTELPRLDLTTLTRLGTLASRVVRAERIAARTHDRAVVEVGARLAGTGDGLAVHPETVRERAAALTEAEAELAAAERALEAHLEEERAAEQHAVDDLSANGDDPSPSPSPSASASSSLSARRAGRSAQARRAGAIAVLLAAFGQLLLVSLDAVPLLAALTLPLLAAFGAFAYFRPREQGPDDSDAEASSFLAEVGASTDERFGARRVNTELARTGDRLTRARDQAQEKMRVAQRAWQALAGDDSDPRDVEAVVRRFDPQHTAAATLASETVSVRAAETVRNQLHLRWQASWRELGLSVPRPIEGEAAVAELTARLTRPIVLFGEATERANELARLAPAAPVVVVDGPSSAT
ncbi:MAG: hypothetical protein ABWZ76_08580 [Acidimicrobiales bacterium]